MRRALILSLPNELLEDILREAQVSTSTLYALANTCSRLLQLCLGLYIKQCGLVNPEERCVVTIPERPAKHDLLSALCQLPIMTRAQYFQCNFPCGKMALERMLCHFDRVERLLSRLSSLGEVVLNFDTRKRPYGNLRDKDILAWSRSLGRLLSTILERGCTSLRIYGLSHMTDVYEFATPKAPTQSSLLTALKGLFSGPDHTSNDSDVLSGETWQFRRQSSRFSMITPRQLLTPLSPEARSQSKLTHFIIASKSLLCPPLFHWTFSVISTSPLTNLTIQDIEFSGPTWTIMTSFLPRATPTLKELLLTNVGPFRHKEITAFMHAFPKLEYLSVSGSKWLWEAEVGGRNELRIAEECISSSLDLTKECAPGLKTLVIVLDGDAAQRGSAPESLLSPAQMLLTRLAERGSDLHFAVHLG